MEILQTCVERHRQQASAKIAPDEWDVTFDLIRQLSAEIGRQDFLLAAASAGYSRDPTDAEAFTWIHRSLEDIQATIIGLSSVSLPWSHSARKGESEAG